jgi:kynureninase
VAAAGAAGLSAIFVHSKHARDDATYPRLAGWWGVPLKSRFVMAHGFDGAAGASAFGVSNVNPLMVACVHASLSLYAQAGGIAKLRRKSLLLTAYLEALLIRRGLLSSPSGGATDGGKKRRARATLRLLTPSDPAQRGCQLSLRVVPAAEHGGPALTMKALEKALTSKGVVGDSREPDVIRIAPVPLYNSFGDVRRVVDALEACLA